MKPPQRLDSFFEEDLGEAPVALDWSACGRWLSVINVNSEILLVDSTEVAVVTRWRAHNDEALAMSWHPRLPMLATSCRSGVCRRCRCGLSSVCTKKVSRLATSSTRMGLPRPVTDGHVCRVATPRTGSRGRRRQL